MQTTSLSSPTRYEQRRINAMLRLGCVACAVLDIPFAEVELHHMLSGNVRMGHEYTLGLCAGHHRGQFTTVQRVLIPEVAREKKILGDALVAISDGRKAFSRVYGTERELWEKVQQRLHLPAIWPTTKILPRRHSHVASTARALAGDSSPLVSVETRPDPMGVVVQAGGAQK